MLCYAACPQYALVPEFIGPAAIALAHRYNPVSYTHLLTMLSKGLKILQPIHLQKEQQCC